MPRYKDNTPISEEVAEQMKEIAQELENQISEEPLNTEGTEEPVSIPTAQILTERPEEMVEGISTSASTIDPTPDPVVSRTPGYGRPVKRYSREFVRITSRNDKPQYHAKKAGRRGK